LRKESEAEIGLLCMQCGAQPLIVGHTSGTQPLIVGHTSGTQPLNVGHTSGTQPLNVEHTYGPSGQNNCHLVSELVRNSNSDSNSIMVELRTLSVAQTVSSDVMIGE
jgi:hypothetical protein